MHVDGAVELFGGASHRFPVRSVVKPIQALALVRSPAAGSTTDEHLAIAAASHNGEPRHVAVVTGWLEQLGLTEDTLQCPAAVPFVNTLAEEYLRAGRPRRRAVHNCSGKHAGFLAQAVAAGADASHYLSIDEPVQRAVMAALEDACRTRITPDVIARDGCGAPVACLTLDAIARGIVSLCPRGENASEGARIIRAISAHPFLLAGSHRFDTRMVEVTQGRCLSKVGADGMHIAVVPALGLAVAVKALDGAGRAAEAALTMVVADRGGISVDEMAEVLDSAVRDGVGLTVGEIRARFEVA